MIRLFILHSISIDMLIGHMLWRISAGRLGGGILFCEKKTFNITISIVGNENLKLKKKSTTAQLTHVGNR